MTGIYQAIETVRGKPIGRVVAEGTREEVLEHWVAGQVAVVWTDTTRIKRLSKASLAKRRKTRLANRMAQKFPLFASEFEARELEARPAFFDGVR